jgi:hypothetical protein
VRYGALGKAASEKVLPFSLAFPAKQAIGKAWPQMI